MADPIDPTEDILRYDELSSRVKDLEEKLETARQKLNSDVGSGKTLQEINAALQTMLQNQSGNTASGQSNLTFTGQILGSAIGSKLASILPSGGVKAGALTAIGGSVEVNKIFDSLVKGTVTFTKLGELGLSAFSAWSGVAKVNQSLVESGALTGQGEMAGVGQIAAAVKDGWQSLVNPFALTSIEFADKIIGTFRETGFKDSLAYALAGSVVSLNNQIGEKMTKQLLPVITDIAESAGNQTTNLGNYSQNVINAVSSLTDNVKVLQKSSVATNTSAAINLQTYSGLLETVRQQGFINSLTPSLLRDFTFELGAKTGYGLTGNIGNAAQSLNALVQHGIIGAYTHLTPQQAYSTSAHQQATLIGFGQFFENMFAEPMMKDHPASYWLSHQNELQDYIALRVMPVLSMLGVTMSPDQVKKMLTDSFTGGKPAIKALTSIFGPNAPIANESSLLTGAIGHELGKWLNMGMSPLNKSTEKLFFEKGLTKPMFTKLMSKFPDSKGISYDEFKQAILANPDMNISQWIQAKLLEAHTREIGSSLAVEGVSQDRINKVDQYLQKYLPVIEQQAAQGTINSKQFSQEVGDIVQVIIATSGSTSAFEKALNKKIKILVKKNNKTIQNTQKAQT